MTPQGNIVGVIVQDEAVRIRLARWRGQLPDRLRTVISGATKKIESTAKTSLVRGKKSGHVYKRGSKSHRASAPGEAPASDTGDLLSHVVSDVSEVGATVKHGLHLELGTDKMKPRPFLIPALKRHGPEIEGAIIRELDR